MQLVAWLSRFWRWIVAEVQAAVTVARKVPGAPTGADSSSTPTSLVFSVSVLNLDALGSGGTYTASVVDQRGNVIVPDTGPAYQSSDTSVFTVDPDTGAITAVGQGTAVLIARLGSARPGLFTVKVNQVPATVDVPGMDPTISFGTGENRRAHDISVEGDTDDLSAGEGTDMQAASIALSPSGELDLDIAA